MYDSVQYVVPGPVFLCHRGFGNRPVPTVLFHHCCVINYSFLTFSLIIFSYYHPADHVPDKKNEVPQERT